MRRKRKPSSKELPLACVLDVFGVLAKYNIKDSELGFADLLRITDKYEEDRLANIRGVLSQAGRDLFAWGAIDSQEFLARLNAAVSLPKPITPRQLDFQWSKTYSPRPEVLDLLPKLAKVTPIYLATNCNDIDADWAKAQNITNAPWVREVISSCDVKAKKPEDEFFVQMRERISANLRQAVEFRQLLFIDDLWGNVQAATRLGMEAVLFGGPDTIKTVLRRCGKK